MDGLNDLMQKAGISGEGAAAPTGNTQAVTNSTDENADTAQSLQNDVIDQYEARRGGPRPKGPRKPRRPRR